ncbi:MAG: hypothetical protein H0W72_05060 [Planctomycetes bacterium]|nr:hypothetical protein [Planctomycetota bacterium]
MATRSSRRGASRRGALLIIVTGLAALLLSLALTFLSTMRSDGERTRAIVRDTQARIMLSAAICYVLETSRLGWGDQETQGWNDVRNHAVGPIPIDADPEAGDPRAPTNRVWTSGEWPAPGTSMRAAMAVWERAPAAVRAGPRNPIAVGPGLPLQDDADENRILVAGLHGDYGSYRSLGDAWRVGSYDRPDPAAVVDPRVDPLAFRAGDAKPRPGTSNLAWFRVYRESAGDHDGDRVPYYDVLDLNAGRGADWNGAADIAYPPNASVFVVTCGAGASLGFRDWDEVLASDAGGTFLDDSAYFAEIRGAETVLWYRIEWSAQTGDYGPKGRRMNWSTPFDGSPIWDQIFSMPSQGGSIRWVQRLDREPPAW